jgi:hypothetical protein
MFDFTKPITKEKIAKDLKKIIGLANRVLQREFLKDYEFESENVEKYVTIEFDVIDEDDLKKHAKEMLEISKNFTEAENVEYLTTLKKWYEFKYERLSYEDKIRRLEELSELSLFVPIDINKPIKYIEFMTIARSIPAFAERMTNFTDLDDYISNFASKMVNV